MRQRPAQLARKTRAALGSALDDVVFPEEHVMSGSTIELRPKAQRISADERSRTMQNLGFGRVFTEHMVTLRYEHDAWGGGVLEPYGPLSLDPAASVLHYGQAIFEGFKAYR